MKSIFLIFCFLIAAALGGASYLTYQIYSTYKGILNQKSSEWFYPAKNISRYLRAVAPKRFIGQINNQELWESFHLKDVFLPLPVKSPFYQVVPEFLTQFGQGSFGLNFITPKSEVLLKVYLNTRLKFPEVKKSQKIFRLPIVEELIDKYDKDKLWYDLMTKDISDYRVGLETMVYHLYLMELRSKIIPSSFESFSYYENSQSAFVELGHQDKNFGSLLVLTPHRQALFSYILVYKKNSKRSERLKNYLVSHMSFRPSSYQLSDIIYREFTGLSFQEKVDLKGMLYLLSSWSHAFEKKPIISQMVKYLERGKGNDRQLEKVISYAYEEYGQTFNQLDISYLNLPYEVKLKSKVNNEQWKKSRITPDKDQSEGTSIQNRPITPVPQSKKKIIF